MAFSVFKIIISVSVILAFVGECKCAKIKRQNYDARLYEHFEPDSRYIQYSRTEPTQWSNLRNLLNSKNFTFSSMLCTVGPGAWLLYPEAEYKMGNAQMYYFVLGEHCTRTDDIKSIQPLGKMNELFLKGVILFDKPDFGSVGTLISDEGEVTGEAKSIIFTGGTEYMMTAGNKKICLVPSQSTFEYSYCLLHDTKSSLGIEGSVTVKENCTEDADMRELVIENCFRDGIHEIFEEQDITVDNLNGVCSGGGDDFTKTKFSLLMEVWQKRLSMNPFVLPPDFFETIKVSILTSVLAIFKEVCPAVDSIYIYIIGHFYLMHIKEVWKKERAEANATAALNDTTTTSTKDGWNFANNFFIFCLEHRDQVPTFKGKSCRTEDQFSRDVESGANPEKTWYDIASGKIYDPIIEQMWLIFNTVIPICNVVAGYITNDWSELVLLFHTHFLDNLQDQWLEPGEWSRIYTTALHGYDLRDVHRDIVSCLRNALQTSPEFDPIGRPRSFKEGLLYKFSLPKYQDMFKKNGTSTR